MNNELKETIKKNMIAVGRLLWEKELATGLNGNMSVKVDDQHILLTGSKTCLGLLHDQDILLMNLDGQVIDEGMISTEALLHTDIYKNVPSVKSVLHTHTTFANAYFSELDVLSPRNFESKLYLGEVRSIPQDTPSVTDTAPVLSALKENNVLVLKNHGIVAAGEDLFDCFLLVQCLEEAVKVECFSRLFKPKAPLNNTGLSAGSKKTEEPGAAAPGKKYKLFSQEQIDQIVQVVNADKQLKDMGEKTQMTMELAVKLNETDRVYSFQFENGRIVRVGHNTDAEFLISASAKVWLAVFNRQIDPFVATTQKKMHLKGDYARISKWYAPCSRIFELWQQVPVEG